MSEIKAVAIEIKEKLQRLKDTAILIHHRANLRAKAPGLEEHRENLIRKIVRDFFSVVVILILFYLIAPFIILIPDVGTSLAVAIPSILIAVVVFFLYGPGRLLYDEISKEVHKEN
jgi:VIT1/CCC1 family predicted Fe2+/Mn2+ transporter